MSIHFYVTFIALEKNGLCCVILLVWENSPTT